MGSRIGSRLGSRFGVQKGGPRFVNTPRFPCDKRIRAVKLFQYPRFFRQFSRWNTQAKASESKVVQFMLYIIVSIP